jgi:RES domain-containing protein
MIRTGWRIVPEELAVFVFDGEGARLFGGRWNSVGLPMIYAAEHLSLAALEVRVHIDRTSLKKRYKCITFEFDERLMQVLPATSLPRHWQQEPPPPSLQAVGDHWLASADSVILAVPSVIIPAEHNFLLNPRHPDFKKVKLGKPTDFSFDYRLFQ